MSASVKVMRSFDYCHFEVCIGTDEVVSDEMIDLMRKRAARLVDKAVNQYQIAKRQHTTHYRKDRVEQLRREVEQIEQLDPKDRTPRQQAKVKLLADQDWQAYIDRRYDYEDDYDEDWFPDEDL